VILKNCNKRNKNANKYRKIKIIFPIFFFGNKGYKNSKNNIKSKIYKSATTIRRAPKTKNRICRKYTCQKINAKK